MCSLLSIRSVTAAYQLRIVFVAHRCVYEIQLRGPNNCVHDTRQIASDMQRHYSDSSQGDGTSFSWRHYTDNCQSCSTGNTNSYGANLFYILC
eukprot:COSAG01_NODE_1384_length_10514_cov_17.435046_12_plen_93_part_00